MPVTREALEYLTQKACFAADGVAIENRYSSMTGAAQTRAVVERALEFLIGNGLVTVPELKEGWLQMDPPYDADLIEPKEE